MTQPHPEPGHAVSNPSHPRANRLLGETSPYLLQHAHNPVDWFPWGPEALQRARSENRPIFLSIGYSACHWCHVMERESFENPDIAAVMNDHFVNIKVDREERPDLDQIYMTAVQAMTGHGGWPMSVFLTPDLEPFFGGTYFPPRDSRGMPGFPRVLLSVQRAWVERRDEILASASDMTQRLRALGTVPSSGGSLDYDLIDQAARSLVRAFDRVHGGFGNAPKFLHPMDLKVLLRHHARTGDIQSLQAVTHTLDKMARGGIYDHLGGGFARYSTDERWLVPHFEKMLYDNALLSGVYLEAYQATGREDFARTARETLDYVLNRMTDPAGGFYSTEDADSEGVEGKYYVWTPAEIREILGAERADIFCAIHDVKDGGNWEGHSILNLPRSLAEVAVNLGVDEAQLRDDLAADRAKLLGAREKRIPPAKDTKILTSWNGMMIASMAEGGCVLRDVRYFDAAGKAAEFLLKHLKTENGRLLHCYKDGRARFNGYLDDYSCLIDGLTRLFEISGEAKWIERAIELAGVMLDQFADPDHGAFFYTGKDHEAMIARQKDVYDNATPSANGTATTALLRLGALTGREDLSKAGRQALEAAQVVMAQAPSAAGQHLIALDFELSPPREIVLVVGDEAADLDRAIEAVNARFLPNKVVAPGWLIEPETLSRMVPLLADRPSQEGKVTTYICERYTCRQPVVGLEDLEKALDAMAKESNS